MFHAHTWDKEHPPLAHEAESCENACAFQQSSDETFFKLAFEVRPLRDTMYVCI